MKGQASIEIIFIVSVAIVLAFFVLSKFVSVQDDVFVSAAIRQELIGQIEKLDAKYELQEIHSSMCRANPRDIIKVVILIQPTPSGPDQSTLTRTTTAAVQKVTGPSKDVTVAYNNLAALAC
ncbi:MAG TPA: hypothetical protein VJG83_06100 [archaeon]|nr:hypothetical protein [archaeon]